MAPQSLYACQVQAPFNRIDIYASVRNLSTHAVVKTSGVIVALLSTVGSTVLE